MMTQTIDQTSNPISIITGEVNQSKQLQEALNEISTLRCKLDSKARALVILSQDLLECKRERDEYKLVSDQVKEKYSSLKKRIDSFGSGLVNLSNSHGGNESIDGFGGGSNNLTSTSFAQILCQLKDQNKSLLYELEDHKTKLIDCEGDIRMLRGQLNMMKRRPISELNSFSSYNMTSTNFHGTGQGRQGRTDNHSSSSSGSASLPSEDKQSLVTQLELIKNRNSMLERDVQSLLDEKEELIVSRDAYKAKVERLNERLNNLLVDSSNCDEQTAEKIRENFKTLDIEGLLDENNFLRGKITTLDEEKIRLKNIIDKYRKILEKNNSSNNNFLLDSKFSDESSHRSSHHNQRSGSSISSSNVISSKQVQHFIATNLSNLTLSQSSLAHLKSLVIALYEALTDKSAALALQRKNNRLLGERLEELEEKVRQLKAREKVFFLMRDDHHHVKSEIVSDSPHTSADLEDLSDGDMNRKIDEQSSGNHHHPFPVVNKNDLDNMKSKMEDQRSEEEDDNDDDDEETQLPSNLEALIEEESAKIAEEYNQSGTMN